MGKWWNHLINGWGEWMLNGLMGGGMNRKIHKWMVGMDARMGTLQWG